MRDLKIYNRPTDRTFAIEKYFNNVNAIRMLSPDEEVELTDRIKAGDMEALNKLVEANLRFVISVAKQYQRTDIDLNDLIQAGNNGIIEAAKRFDASRGFKFISYAVWWIRQRVQEEIAQNRIIRLPNHRIHNQLKENKLHELNKQKMCSDEPENLVPNSLPYVSKRLEDPVSESECADNFGDFLSDTVAGSEDSHLMRESLRRALEDIIAKTLDTREAFIIRYRFGIQTKTGIEHTLEDIAGWLGITRERCRQIEFMALRKLRKNSNVLQQFLN